MKNRIDSGWVYAVIALNILLFYYLFAKTGNAIFLILFFVEWIGFTVYGFILILKPLLTSHKKKSTRKIKTSTNSEAYLNL